MPNRYTDHLSATRRGGPPQNSEVSNEDSILLTTSVRKLFGGGGDIDQEGRENRYNRIILLQIKKEKKKCYITKNFRKNISPKQEKSSHLLYGN